MTLKTQVNAHWYAKSHVEYWFCTSSGWNITMVCCLSFNCLKFTSTTQSEHLVRFILGHAWGKYDAGYIQRCAGRLTDSSRVDSCKHNCPQHCIVLQSRNSASLWLSTPSLVSGPNLQTSVITQCFVVVSLICMASMVHATALVTI